IGDLPIVTSVFPLGLQRGTSEIIHLQGVNLGDKAQVSVRATADARPGTWLPVTIETPQGKPLGNPRVVVGEFPEVICRHAKGLSTPGTANGRIAAPGKNDTWHFHANKGERWIVEVNARRSGSPLDSVIEVLDVHGQPVPRATLRCLA